MNQKPKTNAYYNRLAKSFRPGDQVEVFSLIGCEGDCKGTKTVRHIGPTNSTPGSPLMIWFVEGGGAWHPGAVKKLIQRKV